MTAYISVSFSKRKLADKAINAIINTLQECNITPFVFVDKYRFEPSQEKQMMRQAIAGIESCDLLIAECSDKAIGIGIEAGYAKAKNKPVVYIRHKEAAHSTTLSGISDFQVIYNDTIDLQKQLAVVIEKIAATNNRL